jgi:glucuronoarabinoxylan endo-1,4-beta-xylanase
VQNEPDYCPSTYDGAIWSDANFDAFIKNNLGPTLAAQGQSGVRIMMPESSQWGSFTGEADTCMTDPGCASYVGINAWHDYDNASSISNPYSSGGSGFWETEASAGPGFGPSLCGGCWDPSMADGLLWAGIIDNRMAVSNATAWNYWWLIGKNGDNEGLVNGGVTSTSKRLYVMGNYSKFVRPGWVRMDATHVPLSGVTVSAYKDPVSGNFAIVATNQNGSDVSVTFSLSGFTASSVTPWITSTSLNLVQQSGIGVASGTFSATLPASSVTTFAGSAGN